MARKKANVTGQGARFVAAAMSRKVGMTRNGPKATETDHLRPDQFAGTALNGLKGRHHTAGGGANRTSVIKNIHHPSYQGKHADYRPRHAAESHESDHWKDVSYVIKNGGYGSYGKHSRSV